MVKILKITARLVLIFGLIVLSFKPSASKYVSPNLIHPHHVAFSKFASLSQRTPFSSNGFQLRSSFEKIENQRHLPVAVVAVPAADILAFNVPGFHSGTPRVSLIVTASSPSQTVVLRI